jgi:hypothetical protein
MKTGKLPMRTYTQLHHAELAPPVEMKTPKQLPADFRDWLMARTFEIGAEMPCGPIRRKLGKAGSVQGANLASDLIFKRDNAPILIGLRRGFFLPPKPGDPEGNEFIFAFCHRIRVDPCKKTCFLVC